jgi:hypothetical protein
VIYLLHRVEVAVPEEIDDIIERTTMLDTMPLSQALLQFS